MEDRFIRIEAKLVEIDKKLDKILSLCEIDIKPACNRMDKHITFIESVYNHVRHPLWYICSMIPVRSQIGDSDPSDTLGL